MCRHGDGAEAGRHTNSSRTNARNLALWVLQAMRRSWVAGLKSHRLRRPLANRDNRAPTPKWGGLRPTLPVPVAAKE